MSRLAFYGLVCISLLGCSAYARLELDSEPSGARVFKNGSYIGTTPMEYYLGQIPDQYISWPEGKVWDPGVTLTAYKTGYKERTLHPRLNTEGVQADETWHTWSFMFLLEPQNRPAPARPEPRHEQQQQQQQQTIVVPGNQGGTGELGTVMVSSNVEGADVSVNGVFVGNTPANLKLKDALYVIEVSKSGYTPYRKELRVYGGSELSVRAELTR